MENYLAVAIWGENPLLVASRSVDPTARAQEVADYLKATFKSWGTPDQILMIANQSSGPMVMRHWNAGKDYE